jgi:hypothetical protein
MTTANILCFLSGSLVATVAAAMYAIHAERVNWHNIMAARSAGYNEGLAIGKMQPLQPVAPTREVKP